MSDAADDVSRALAEMGAGIGEYVVRNRWQARAEAAERRLLMLATTAKSAVIVFDGSETLTGSQAAAIDALRRRVEEVVE